MAHTAGMVHAVADNARYFGRVAAEVMPGIELVHLVDGGLPSMSGEALRPRVIERLQTLSIFAQESGAEAILLTCTAFGRLAREVGTAVTCPVLSVLEIMVDEALRLEGVLGLLGSHPGTLAHAERMLREEAALRGRELHLKTRLCDGAFEAMQRDDWATHNSIVAANLGEFANEVDVVVAPQPSMERAMELLGDMGGSARVLTSPRVSALRLRDTLATLT